MSTTTPAQQTVLRLSKPGDVVATIPYLLGFHPHRSLVVIGLHGRRSRVGVTLRMDLDPDSLDEVGPIVVNALRRSGDEEAIVVLFDPPPDESGLPGAETFRAVQEALTGAGIALRDALRVCDQRWSSYLCDDPQCCPPEGTPVVDPAQPGGPAHVGAVAVAAGMAALPNREALAASLQPPAPWAHDAVAQAFDTVYDEIRERCERGEGGKVIDEIIALFRTARGRYAGPNPALTDREVATLAFGLENLAIRDEVLTWTTKASAPALQHLLVEMVRRVGPPDNVAASTALAWCAYVRGNGSLAAVALEQALAADPDYSLARLIDHALQNQIHPDLLRQMTKQTRKDLARRRAGQAQR